MKCFKHNAADAVAVCAYCGKGICSECVPSSIPKRLTCSSMCAESLVHDGKLLQSLFDKNVQGAKATAFYYYLCSALSAAAGGAAWFMLPAPFLIYFTFGCAAVLAVAGFWHGRVGRE